MAKQQAIPPDFKALLSKPLDSFERPIAVPAGTYFGVIKGYRFAPSRFGKDRGTQIHIEVSLTGPTEDIPAEELEGVDLSKLRNLSREYEPNYIFNDFLESLGHDTKGKSADEFLPLLEGADVLVELTSTEASNGKDHFNNVKRIFGA